MSLLQKKIITFTLLLVFLLVLVFFFLVEQDEIKVSPEILEKDYPTAEQKMPHEIETKQKRVPSEEVLPYKSLYGPLPGTLEGTVMQQALVVDEDGNLRISSDLKRVFDFFLSTIEFIVPAKCSCVLFAFLYRRKKRGQHILRNWTNVSIPNCQTTRQNYRKKIFFHKSLKCI